MSARSTKMNRRFVAPTPFYQFQFNRQLEAKKKLLTRKEILIALDIHNELDEFPI